MYNQERLIWAICIFSSVEETQNQIPKYTPLYLIQRITVLSQQLDQNHAVAKLSGSAQPILTW